MDLKNVTDTFLVGVDFTHGRDTGVLIVGRKRKNETLEVINAFQGDEAWELYQKLTTVKKEGETT